MRFTVFSLALLTLAGCSQRAVRAPIPASNAAAQNRLPYVDLEPGWRLRVITPITRSGKLVPQTSQSQQSGHTITLSASSDFLGYETDYYAIDRHGRDGVRIRFLSAADMKGGVTTPDSSPRLSLFQVPRSAKFVRLLYLRRESGTDHDMAVLGASNRDLLATLTDDIQADPRACYNGHHVYCSWIPSGVAVRPELAHIVNGSETWIPAR
jgi:hypothetical protein